MPRTVISVMIVSVTVFAGLCSLTVLDRHRHKKRTKLWRSTDRSKVMTLDHAETVDSATIVEHILGDGNFYSEFDKEVRKFSPETFLI